MALLYSSQGRLSEAFKLMQQAIQVENNLIRCIFAYSSERDRLNYLETIKHNYHAFLSLVSHHLSDSPTAVQTALEVVLQRKCLTASALAAFNYALYSDRYSHLQEKFNNLRSLKQEIIHLTFNPPLPKSEETEAELHSRKTPHQKQLSDLENESERLEKELAKQVPEIQLQTQTSDRKAVALELPTGSVLVEFVRFNVLDFPAKKWQPAEYIAFILPSQQPEAVEMIKLGDAEHIDNLIRIYRETVTSIKLGELGLTREAEASKNQPKSYIVKGIELRQTIYDPLRQSALFQNQANLNHLYIAPDDSLNLIAFENLPLDETDNQLVRDRYTISYLSVGRDILRRQIPSKPAASPALIIANPNFDLGQPDPTTVNLAENQPLALQTSSAQNLKSMTANQVISTLAGTYFAPLPETQFLGELAAKSLGVELYSQDEAVESKLTDGQCPRILLIATHGYFANSENPYFKLILSLLNCKNGEEAAILGQHPELLNQELLSMMETASNLLANNGNENLATWLKSFAVVFKELIEQIAASRSVSNNINRFSNHEIKDPMMRSALAFSGANTWLSGGQVHPQAGKGILLANEVANLDLWGNELTILLACQTALGDTKAGEGVFGLRRAFPAAGSKTLIISLWSVPTKASLLLMERFLEGLKRPNLGRGEALFAAQNYLRTVTIKELQESDLGKDVLQELVDKRYLSTDLIKNQPDFQPLTHPFFWGAWICQGETTNFQGALN